MGVGNKNVNSLMLGWSLPLLTGLLTYPFAMIRSRQTVTKESIKQAYDGQVKERGIIALWDGALLNIGRGLFGALMSIAIDDDVCSQVSICACQINKIEKLT